MAPEAVPDAVTPPSVWQCGTSTVRSPAASGSKTRVAPTGARPWRAWRAVSRTGSPQGETTSSRVRLLGTDSARALSGGFGTGGGGTTSSPPAMIAPMARPRTRTPPTVHGTRLVRSSVLSAASTAGHVQLAGRRGHRGLAAGGRQRRGDPARRPAAARARAGQHQARRNDDQPQIRVAWEQKLVLGLAGLLARALGPGASAGADQHGVGAPAARLLALEAGRDRDGLL